MCPTYIFFGDEKTKTCCIPKKNNPCMVYLSTFAIKTSHMWVTTPYMDDMERKNMLHASSCKTLQESEV